MPGKNTTNISKTKAQKTAVDVLQRDKELWLESYAEYLKKESIPVDESQFRASDFEKVLPYAILRDESLRKYEGTKMKTTDAYSRVIYDHLKNNSRDEK